jgi:hypothetical protein
MLEGVWYALVDRSGLWVAVLATAAFKAALILAATALVLFVLRRRSAALRHQVWLVGVVAALAVPTLTLVLPEIPVAMPWWSQKGLMGEPGGWRGPSPRSLRVEAGAQAHERIASAEAAAQVHERIAAAEAMGASTRAARRELAGAIASAAAEMDAARFALEEARAVVAASRSRAASRRSRFQDRAARGHGSVAHAVPAAPAPHPPLPPIAPVPPLSPIPHVPPVPPVALAAVAPPHAGPHVYAATPPPGMGGSSLAGWPGADGFPWALGLLGVWLLGAWLVAACLVVGVLRVAWLSWQAIPITAGRCATLARAIADELGLREIRVLQGSPTAMPMTWGLVRPTVLLPAGAEDWPVDQLDAVLRHELAHARRRDTATQLVADLACAVYWFNPLAWLAAYRLRVEREHACDDEVLASGSKPSDYATQLLDMTRALRAVRATAMAAIPMARPSQLRGRLEAVLDEGRPREGVSRSVAARSWAAAALLVVPVAMLGFGPSGSMADESGRGFGVGWFDGAAAAPGWSVNVEPMVYAPYELPSLVVEALSAKSAALEVAALVEAFPARWQECGRPGSGRRSGTSIHVNDDRQRIEWYRDGCRYRVEIDGEVGFDDAFRAISSLSPDGRVRIEGEELGGERVVEIRRAGGELAYRYYQDGTERPFDAAARAWLDGVVLELFRTGYAAEERVAALLRRGGPAAVLQELGALRTDYVRRIYYQAALTHPSLEDDDAAELIGRAGGEIRSDYELAELLIATAEVRPFVDDVRDAFIGAAESLESAYERRRVLAEVLARGDLAPRHVAAMLSAASGIGSDYEKAELLVALAARYLDSPELRVAYLETAAAINSDYEKRRVLDGILGDGALSAQETAAVLALVHSMDSDHERAELLVGIAGEDVSAPVVQRAYIAVAADIRSDYDHRRVLEALLAAYELSTEELTLLIGSTSALSSDHDKAEVLLLVARTQTLTEANRAAFLRAVDTLRSDYDHGRVASALLRPAR